MLNEKAIKIYNYIKDSIDSGYSPTVREICGALNIRSTSTVHRYIDLLTDEGYLEKLDNRNRAIRLRGGGGISVPLIGETADGIPVLAPENIIGYIPFKTDRSFSNPLFALKVKGGGMINTGIIDGDIIIAEKTDRAENGQIAVVLADGKNAAVKRFYNENGHYRLQPENDNMEPIITDNVSIVGIVRGLVRYY